MTLALSRFLGFFCLLFLSSCSLLQGTHNPLLPPSVQDLRGYPQNFKSYLGNHTFLILWASWCPECIVELSMLNVLQAKLLNQNIQIVAVAIEDNLGDVLTSPAVANARYPILVDVRNEVKRAYPVSGLPTAYLLDAKGTPIPLLDPEDGTFKKAVVGYREWQSEQGKSAIIQSLRPPLPPLTTP